MISAADYRIIGDPALGDTSIPANMVSGRLGVLSLRIFIRVGMLLKGKMMGSLIRVFPASR